MYIPTCKRDYIIYIFKGSDMKLPFSSSDLKQLKRGPFICPVVGLSQYADIRDLEQKKLHLHFL